MGKAPEEIITDDGKVARRDFSAEIPARGPSGDRPGWPIECFGSGVNANQAQELRDHFKKHNFDCEVSENGNPIYRDSLHRKKALKLRGFCDKASFG
jgi:hypothetical protein